MLRIESETKLQARRVWSYLDAAGFKATPPLPTVGLGHWSVVVEQATRDEVFGALPRSLRYGLAFSELESEGE